MTPQCIRCGKAGIANEEVFVVGFDQDPALKAAIEAELRVHDIEGLNGLAGLCESCCGVAQTAIEEASRVYYASRRDFIRQHAEANLGRPLTPAEWEQMEAYFDGPDDAGPPSVLPGSEAG